MEIRQISIYDRNLKDRYYITSTGMCYTLCKDRAVMIDGERRKVTKHQINEAMSSGDDFSVPFKDWGLKVIILKNGLVLRLLKTFVKQCNSVTVCMFDVNNNEKRLYVSRLVANAFIASVENKEVHHINGNRRDNNCSNLEVLSFEDHRGVGNHSKNHYQV
jgi:hypothetical protein